ncbi:triple gene block protein 2 [Panax ginseng flexivirus 1]|uniref:triple gene block protein 2 n=1 Tax=Panax ginseng flexivirus 1 TaxID=2303411 RepID=UPI000E33005F|nr:triple gene block protein 2 [Panax ginseng flexivirus 1]AXN92354.1 triple gene block protein 2 [Panax ginseng flexivirus 1]
MSFQQPADWSKNLRPLLIGGGVALILFFFRQNNLPHTGDNIHSLPHGGQYQDGTKRINYCGPKKNFPGPGILSIGSSSTAFVILIVLVALIYASERFTARIVRRCPCVPGTCASR